MGQAAPLSVLAYLQGNDAVTAVPEPETQLQEDETVASQLSEHTVRSRPLCAALTLVPTPIGNLDDITLRAITVLKQCDGILAEDTRTTSVLLKHLGINKTAHSYHIHNEHQTVERIIDRLHKGEKLVLVSDAGTPAISDPGFLLVRAVVEAGLEVDCLPGPTAFVPALVRSGIPCDTFVYEGFLPHKKGRQTRLQALARREMTTVFYESPHRLLKTLEALQELCGPTRTISVSRELSKLYEQTVTGPIATVLNQFKQQGVRGEFVVVLSSANDKRSVDDEVED